MDELREEIRALIRETVHEVLEEIVEDESADDNLKFRPDVAEQLHAFLRDQPDGEPVDDILSELGLNGK
jgi:hypothetical protein